MPSCDQLGPVSPAGSLLRRFTEPSFTSTATGFQEWKTSARSSKAADLFLEQVSPEQRRLLHLLVEEASWKGGELRMLLREPFERITAFEPDNH